MVNPIDKALKPIHPPLTRGETLDVYFYGNQKPGHHGYVTHAFSAEYVRSTGGRGSVCDHPPVSDKSSDGQNTSNMRAQLGGLLTTLNWLSLSQAEGHDVTIYGKTFVAKWLMVKLPEWCGDRKRSNWDLYIKFLPYFVNGKWKNTRWSIIELTKKDHNKTVHHSNLGKVEQNVANFLGQYLGSPVLDICAFFGSHTIDDNEWKRALGRDRS